MVNNREDIEECFLKCPTETRQSFMAALQMVYDEVFEINPYDDCVYILNSRYDTAMCGMTVCYSDFFGEYVDAMVYLYDCEEFISDFEPEALRKFAESEDMKQEKKFVRLRTDTNKKEWYIATLIKNQELLETLSQRARFSSGRFNEDVIVSQWIQLIES